MKHAGHAPVPAGSTAVREAIERYNRWSPYTGTSTRHAATRVGKTLCINPGGSYEQGELLGALVDLDGGKKVQEHRS